MLIDSSFSGLEVATTELSYAAKRLQSVSREQLHELKVDQSLRAHSHVNQRRRDENKTKFALWGELSQNSVFLGHSNSIP